MVPVRGLTAVILFLMAVHLLVVVVVDLTLPSPNSVDLVGQAVVALKEEVLPVQAPVAKGTKGEVIIMQLVREAEALVLLFLTGPVIRRHIVVVKQVLMAVMVSKMRLKLVPIYTIQAVVVVAIDHRTMYPKV